ncbi:unnamed protein product [Pylaiella littoralis]
MSCSLRAVYGSCHMKQLFICIAVAEAGRVRLSYIFLVFSFSNRDLDALEGSGVVGKKSRGAVGKKPCGASRRKGLARHREGLKDLLLLHHRVFTRCFSLHLLSIFTWFLGREWPIIVVVYFAYPRDSLRVVKNKLHEKKILEEVWRLFLPCDAKAHYCW